MAAPILVVGSVAFDDIETPAGHQPVCVGGSANYFSASASLFAPVQLVAVVGDDFPQAHLDMLAERGHGVDMRGLEQVEGKTFRWRGRYGDEFGDAETLETQLNVFEHFDPKIPEAFRSAPWVFLGNIHPDLQGAVLDQIDTPRLVGLDTMNFWIGSERAALIEVLGRIDLLIINATEARLLTDTANIFDAADAIRAMGPTILVIKKGAHGATLFHPEGMFTAPAVPLRTLIDPTGAGDTFAAGMMGYIAQADAMDFATLKRGVVNGIVMASFAVQGFSLNRVLTLNTDEIAERTRTVLDLMTL